MKPSIRVSVPLVTALGCLATTVAVAVAATTLPTIAEREPRLEPRLVAFEAALAAGPTTPTTPTAPEIVGASTARDVEPAAEPFAGSADLATEISSARDGSSLWHWLQTSDWLGFVGPYGWGASPGTTADYAAAATHAVGRLSSVSTAEGGYANSGALGAVAFALSKIGAPYQWGATGPSTYDCSGLMLRAYESVGIRLPRVSRHQYLVGEQVSVQALVPGDMVFFAHDVSRPGSIHHVAMYIGEGQMVHAPYTGARVRIDPLRVRGLIGAVRMLPASGVPTATPFDVPGIPSPLPLPSAGAPAPDQPTPGSDPTPSSQPTPSGVTPTLVGPTAVAPPVGPTLVTPPIATLDPGVLEPPIVADPTLITPPIATLNPTFINPPILISTPPPVGPPLAVYQPPPIITGPIRP